MPVVLPVLLVLSPFACLWGHFTGGDSEKMVLVLVAMIGACPNREANPYPHAAAPPLSRVRMGCPRFPNTNPDADFFQTIVLIPLAYVVVFSADCTEVN